MGQALTEVVEEPTHYSRVKLRQLASKENEALLARKREEAEFAAKKDRALDFASERAVVGAVRRCPIAVVVVVVVPAGSPSAKSGVTFEAPIGERKGTEGR